MTMSSPRPRVPAYGEHVPVGSERLSWPRVIARMILVVVPGILVGSFAGGIVVAVLGAQVVRGQPTLSLVVPVLAGLVTGAGLGLVLKPERGQLTGHALAAVGIAFAVNLLLLSVARLRLPGIAPAPVISAYVLPMVLLLACQAAVAVPVWFLRCGPPGTRR